MDKTRALEILTGLAAGIDPLTGEIFPPQSTLQHPEIIRALYVAAIALNGEPAGSRPGKPRNPDPPGKAGMPWTADEDRDLLAAFDSGRSEKELAAEHRRTPNAIRSRLLRYGRIEARPEPVSGAAT